MATVFFHTHGPKEIETLLLAAAEVRRLAEAAAKAMKKVQLDEFDAMERVGYAEEAALRINQREGVTIEFSHGHREALRVGLALLEADQRKLIEGQLELLGETHEMEERASELAMLAHRLRLTDEPELPAPVGGGDGTNPGDASFDEDDDEEESADARALRERSEGMLDKQLSEVMTGQMKEAMKGTDVTDVEVTVTSGRPRHVHRKKTPAGRGGQK